MIADVTLLKSGHTMIVTGKGLRRNEYDRARRDGNPVAESKIRRRRRSADALVVQRGMDRQSYTCAPRCQPTAVLGDDADISTMSPPKFRRITPTRSQISSAAVLLDRLIIGADLRMLAQDRIDRLEHLAHPRFRHRAFDDDDKFRLVGGGAHEAPGAVFGHDAHAIDGDEIADFLAGDCLAFGLHGLECRDDLIDDPYLRSSSQCGAMVGEPQVFGRSA